jgi:hypothetical protein
LESDETADRNIFPEFGNLFFHQLVYRLVIVFHKTLLQQAGLFKKFADTTLDDLLDDRPFFSLLFSLNSKDSALAIHVGFGSKLFAQITRARGRNVHGDVIYKIGKLVRFRNEIGLAIHFNEHSDLATAMDVRMHASIISGSPRLLMG